MSDALTQARELLDQSQLNSEMADVRHTAMREAFEQRECDSGDLSCCAAGLDGGKAEVTVAEFRVQVLEPAAGDERGES